MKLAVTTIDGYSAPPARVERNAYLFVCRNGGTVFVFNEVPKERPRCEYGCGGLVHCGPSVLSEPPPPHTKVMP